MEQYDGTDKNCCLKQKNKKKQAKRYRNLYFYHTWNVTSYDNAKTVQSSLPFHHKQTNNHMKDDFGVKVYHFWDRSNRHHYVKR